MSMVRSSSMATLRIAVRTACKRSASTTPCFRAGSTIRTQTTSCLDPCVNECEKTAPYERLLTTLTKSVAWRYLSTMRVQNQTRTENRKVGGSTPPLATTVTAGQEPLTCGFVFSSSPRRLR